MALTPELEIAWARAVARAVDDPAFAERLKHFPKETLESLGTVVPDGVEPSEFTPAPDKVMEAAERYRAAQANAAAEAARGQAAAGEAPTASRPGAQAEYVPQTASILPMCHGTASVYTASMPPACYGATHVTASPPPPTASVAYPGAPVCVYFACLPVACRREPWEHPKGAVSSAPATVRDAPAQWVGSRPSMGGL